jgi:hypothetical protein
MGKMPLRPTEGMCRACGWSTRADWRRREQVDPGPHRRPGITVVPASLRFTTEDTEVHRLLASLLGPTEVGEATLLRSRPDRERLRARQPTSQITSRGQRVGVWAQPSGALRGGAPVTLGGKIESASAGSGERAGDGPFAVTHLHTGPAPAPRPVARQPQGTSKVPVSSSLFAATPEVGGGSASAADWTSRRPNARPSTCFEALYEPKRIAW